MRAGRVAAHSFVQGREALKRLADDTDEIGVDPVTGVGVMLRSSYSPGEVIESAAARVRPIILERKDCYYRKALSALGPSGERLRGSRSSPARSGSHTGSSSSETGTAPQPGTGAPS